MASRAFIDTNYVLALINRRDEHHRRALALADAYDRGPSLTTEAVLLEIGNALAKNYRAAAVAILGQYRTSGEVEVVPLDSALFDDALDLHSERRDKTWGLVDCVSFVAMRRAGITDALTSDRHFAQAGFRILMGDDPPT